jgi:hypothetical protein
MSRGHKRSIAIGEESWMQDAADELVTNMMRKYNRINPLFLILCKCTVGIDWIT